MNIATEITPAEEKDYYYISLNGMKLGKFERSQIRQFIGDLDNGIN